MKLHDCAISFPARFSTEVKNYRGLFSSSDYTLSCAMQHLPWLLIFEIRENFFPWILYLCRKYVSQVWNRAVTFFANCLSGCNEILKTPCFQEPRSYMIRHLFTVDFCFEGTWQTRNDNWRLPCSQFPVCLSIKKKISNAKQSLTRDHLCFPSFFRRHHHIYVLIRRNGKTWLLISGWSNLFQTEKFDG